MARFKQVWPERGMDEKYAGLVVPDKGSNMVLLEGGAGLRLRIPDPRYFRVAELKSGKRKDAILQKSLKQALAEDNPVIAEHWFEDFLEGKVAKGLKADMQKDRLFLFKAKRPGMTKIFAVAGNSSALKAKLTVSVHRQRTVPVTFNFLQCKDRSGSVRKMTRWSPSNVDNWLKVLNTIFQPQANIVFRLNNKRWITSERDLGKNLDQSEWPAVSALRDQKAELNIFIVGDWIGTNDPNGEYFRNTKDAVCDDRPNESLLLQTMSHEIGHHLGGTHSFDRKAVPQDYVMAASPRTGNKIFHQWAINWNPW